MAAQDYYGVVQQLYISYFGRPADYFGLQNFAQQLDAIDAPTEFDDLQAAVQAGNNSALNSLVNSFNNSPESIALYGNDNSQLGISKFIAAIYQNVLGREADPEGFAFWVDAVTSGKLTKANAAAAITAAATTNTSAQGLLDAQTVENKLAVATAFTDSLDVPSKWNAYAGDAAAATARGLLQGVNNSTNVEAYQANIDTAIDSIVNVAVPGQTFSLTANVDNLLGTAGNDNFVATVSATANPIGALDVIDGGAGRDTFSIADTGTAQLNLTGLTLRNIENLAVSSNNAYTNLDISNTGVTSATIVSAATTGTSLVTAAGTTDVTLSTATGANATVAGGKAVTVNGSGTNTVTGAALTGVTVNGGTAVINNTATSGNGTTLTSVTLDGVTGAGNTITGNGVTTINLADITTVTGVALTNATTGGHTLNLNVNNVGYTAAGAAVAVTVTDTTATRVAVTATADSNVAVVAAAATAATVAGAGDLELNLAGSTRLTSLDTSAATGTVALANLAAGLVSIKGGAAAEEFTTTQTTKVAFDLGAGNDSVTIGSQIVAGSVINLGAGNDALLASTGGAILASTATASTIIDGGEGSDTISASLINASNAAQFRNFEALDMSEAANLDVQLITGSTIAGLTLFGGAGGATLTNVGAAVGLTVAGLNTGTSTIGVATASATDNVFNIGFSGAAVSGAAATASNIDAGTVILNGIETVNIASAGAANTWNEITLGDTDLKTVTITGDKNLDLDFTGTVGATGTGNGLALVDGSAATGDLAIDFTAGTPTYNLASAGLTVRTGAGDDTITLAGKATVVAGAGDDTIITAAAGGTLTGGAGDDTFDVSASVAPATPTAANSVLTTITDFAAGDSIVLGVAAGSDFATTKVALGSTVTNLDLAIAQAASGAEDVTWFQYGTDTYIVAETGTADGFDAGDVVVKLTGLIDLSTATISADGIVTL